MLFVRHPVPFPTRLSEFLPSKQTPGERAEMYTYAQRGAIKRILAESLRSSSLRMQTMARECEYVNRINVAHAVHTGANPTPVRYVLVASSDGLERHWRFLVVPFSWSLTLRERRRGGWGCGQKVVAGNATNERCF